MTILRRKLAIGAIVFLMVFIVSVLPFMDLPIIEGFSLGLAFSGGLAILFVSRFLWLWSLSRYSLKPIQVNGRQRYWVETDEKLLAASIKIMVCADAGFSASISESAFAKGGKKVILSIMRISRVDNRDDMFIIRVIVPDDKGFLNSFETRFENVNEAVDEFIALWRDWQIGEEWINIRSPKFLKLPEKTWS